MDSLLQQLKKMTVVVADTSDLESIEKWKPQDVTTNPTLITAAAGQKKTQDLLNMALRKAILEAGKGASRDLVLDLATDHLSVEFGAYILKFIYGRVSTELDPRLSYDMQACVEKARRITDLYQMMKIPRDRILIKITSTYEGIKAAEILEREGIHCNLTLLFGLHQAVAAAEARVTLISPFVGRILDWYKMKSGRQSYLPSEDPGVISVTSIYHYLKHFGYQTELMGASFRNIGEITELAGCDLLTISPTLLSELDSTTGVLVKKLSPDVSRQLPIEKIKNPLDATIFEQAHQQNIMAKEKLQEGIKGFTDALLRLQGILSDVWQADASLSAGW